MSAPFRFPRFFVTTPAPCPYLPGKTERKVFTELNGPACQRAQRRARPDRLPPQPERRLPAELPRLRRLHLGPGRRRRVPAERTPSAACSSRNADLEVTACKAWATEEQYELLRRYLRARHPGRRHGRDGRARFRRHGRAEPGQDLSSSSIASPPIDGEPGRLVGACLTDQQADGLSMIYSFFEPDDERRAGPRHLHHPRPYRPRRPRRPALRLSRLLGRGIAAHGLQVALPPARAARPRRLAAVRSGAAGAAAR